MNFTTFIKKFKKDFSFRKRVLLIGGIGLLVVSSIIVLAKDTNLSASVLGVSRRYTKQVGTCTDTDGGINYDTQGTITVVANGATRTERDKCNPDGTLKERFCGGSRDTAGLLRSENYVNCEYGCSNGVCLTTDITVETVVQNYAPMPITLDGSTFTLGQLSFTPINGDVGMRQISLLLSGYSLTDTPYTAVRLEDDGDVIATFMNNGNNELFMTDIISQTLSANTTKTYDIVASLKTAITTADLGTPFELILTTAKFKKLINNDRLDASPLNVAVTPVYYATGNVIPTPVNCSDPVNVLACSLGLASCPAECTGQIVVTPVDCSDPENVLACSLGLASCPAECTGELTNCSNPNVQYACADCDTPENTLSCMLGLDSCPAACSNPGVTNTGWNCPTQCAPCTDSDGGQNYFIQGYTRGIFASNNQYTENYDYCLQNTSWLVENFCRNGLVDITVVGCEGCGNGACTNGEGYGYGYGYGWGGQGTGYGYGYGYAKLDPNTKQPYLYLIDVFKTYTKKIYDTVINTLGVKMVKSYNTKEFSPSLTTKKSNPSLIESIFPSSMRK